MTEPPIKVTNLGHAQIATGMEQLQLNLGG